MVANKKNRRRKKRGRKPRLKIDWPELFDVVTEDVAHLAMTEGNATIVGRYLRQWGQRGNIQGAILERLADFFDPPHQTEQRWKVIFRQIGRGNKTTGAIRANIEAAITNSSVNAERAADTKAHKLEAALEGVASSEKISVSTVKRRQRRTR